MIDIVTVVFDAELPVLKLQAQSIDLYCRCIGVRNIYVVVNDHDSVAEQIDPAWWGSFAKCVIIVPRRLFSAEFVDNGWVSQQVLKLLAASTSYNIWSMILDAKTIFVRDLDLAEIVSDNKINAGFLPIQPVFEPSQNIVNNFYNINLEQQLGPAGVPFFFHNATVRSLIADVEKITSINFVEWFQSYGRLTEFILYSGYVQFKHGSFNTLYSSIGKIQPNNICHSEVKQFDNKLDTAAKTNIHTISIHRNAWSQLTPEQQQQYRDLLIQRGITQAESL